MTLTAKRLKEKLHYAPTTGKFTRIGRTKQHVGTLDPKGYVRIGVDYKVYKAHRLAWLYMTGEWPKDQIDHIDSARANNAWANLREATNLENQQNRTEKPKTNALGAVGIQRLPNGKYRAKISVNNTRLHLGCYTSASEARAAYVAARRLHHPNSVRAK